MRAVDELAQLGGVDVVRLGIDFFPITGKWAEFQNAHGTRNLAWAIPDSSHMREITGALSARNYSDGEILAILGGNMLRVLGAAI